MLSPVSRAPGLSRAHESIRARRTNFEGAVFVDSWFRGADLRGERLDGIRLDHARMEGADLRGATLRDGVLTELQAQA